MEGPPAAGSCPSPEGTCLYLARNPWTYTGHSRGPTEQSPHGQAQTGTHRKPPASAPHVAPRAAAAAGLRAPVMPLGRPGGQGLREGIPEPHGRPHRDQHPGCADGKASGRARPKSRASGPQTVSFLLTPCWYLWTRPSRQLAGSVLLPLLQSKTLSSWVKSRKQVPVCDRVPCPRDAGRPHRMPGAELLAGVRAARGRESGGPAVVCSHKN